MTLKVLGTDLDGILFNSMEKAYQINRQIQPDLTRDVYARWFDGNIFAKSGNDNVETDTLNDADALFFELYDQAWPEIDIQTAVAEIYKELHSHGVVIEGITSNCEQKVELKLQQFELRDIFSGLGGHQTHKSKVVKFEIMQKKYPHAHIVHATDTVGDVLEAQEARKNGVANISNIIGVTWGLESHDRTRFETAKTQTIVEHPHELRDQLFASFGLSSRDITL